MNNNKTGKYLHCIIKGKVPKDRFSVKGAAPACGWGSASGGNLAGLEGNAAYAVNQGNLSCLVSDTSCDHYPLWREHIIAHQKPIEEVMKHYEVLPFSFSNIANTEDQIKKILKERKDEFEELLQKFKGKTEVGLKALWPDMKPVFQKINEKSPEIQRLKKNSCLTYQQQIFAGEFVEKLLKKRKEEEAKNILEAVGSLSEDFKESQLIGENMILNAAFLIKKDQKKMFDQKIGKLEKKHKDIKFYYSGPFPLYNFVDLKIHLV
ncbi:GvpL/GvpF family gas vesicle protein [Patescibacteria group bacterium]|nr:GvpL/GvpF family gas vesicle protein [Patescibacteria group bacterium]MBU4369086.1 GvpL/GvpF family gas vesicle protein [Patescibacteria group bacterium]